jgi:hypothetical protein
MLPDFRPVTTAEYAEVNDTAEIWARSVFRDHCDQRYVRRVTLDAWAITDVGQMAHGKQPGADAAYIEWLLVQCDRVIDGELDDREEALEAFWWIEWEKLEDEERDEVAVAILVALSETDWISNGKPRQKAKTVFLKTAQQVTDAKSAARVTRALRAMGPRKFDQWRRAIRNEDRSRRSRTSKQCYLAAWLTSRQA